MVEHGLLGLFITVLNRYLCRLCANREGNLTGGLTFRDIITSTLGKLSDLWPSVHFDITDLVALHLTWFYHLAYLNFKAEKVHEPQAEISAFARVGFSKVGINKRKQCAL